MNKNSRWMAISGASGCIFFLVANFTDIFLGLNLISGIIQIAINVFVFVTWLRGYRASRGFKKFVAFWGVVFPFVMAGVTLFRVLLPALFN